MASDAEITSLLHTCSAVVNVSHFPPREVFSVGTPQTQTCHCWGGTAVPTALGRPLGPQNHQNAEFRSPSSFCISPPVRLPFKHNSPICKKLSSWWTCQPQRQQEPVLQILFQRAAAAALLWRAFPLSFSWSFHSMKNLHKALKNFLRDSFVMKLHFDSSLP